MLVLIKLILAYVTSWICWRVFWRFLAKSPLDNIPGPPAKSLWKGVFPQIFNANAWAFHKEIAEKYGGVIKIKGFFGDIQLYVFDPKAMYHIVDQYIYEETSAFIHANRLVFGPGLMSTLGEQHRKQKRMLNPVFSVNHIREMLPIFYNITFKLRDAFTHRVRGGAQEIEVLSWMSRTALELIGQSGLGYSFDPLTDDEAAHPYSVSAKNLVPANMKLMAPRTYLLDTAVKIGTPRFRRFVMGLLPWKALHDLRDITDVLHKTSVEIFEEKKRALEEGDEAVVRQIGQGKDILSILMKANMDASEEERLTTDELIGQMSSLTFAAMDTTTSALSRTLWLLSAHPHVQEQLRQEIKEARKIHKEFTYDALVSLPYLDALCRETLRLYPPVPFVIRTTRKDISLPVSTAIRALDHTEITDIAVPNDTNIIVSIIQANRNPEVWGPDSYEWKPERWLEPLPESVAAAHIPGIYSNLMTFLGGGKACIGFKFSQLEMKVVLSVLVEAFRFSPTNKEIFWELSGIVSPVVVGGNGQPQLPLVVELAG